MKFIIIFFVLSEKCIAWYAILCIIELSLNLKETVMYLEEIPDQLFTTTLVRIRYDCHGEERMMKWCDANKNFKKNNGKHICHKCQLKENNPAKRKEVQEKIKKTNLEKYGTTMPMNSEENIEKKRKQFENEEFKTQFTEKRKKTSLEKYGVEHPMQCEEIQEKQKQVLLEKYGVEHPLQNKEILEKTQQTNLERYGNICSLNNPGVRAKSLKTLFENYGVEYYNQLPEMKDYLRENCKEWLKESWANPWSKGTIRPEEWNEKQSKTMTELIQKGEIQIGPKNTIKGFYNATKCKKKNPIFRSSYELKTHWHLDNDDNVEWYDYEPFQISYYDTENKKRHYTVDFLVLYKDGKLVAIEVKNNYTINLEETNIKYTAFIKECGDYLQHEFWTNEKIISLNLDIEHLLGSELVTVFSNK